MPKNCWGYSLDWQIEWTPQALRDLEALEKTDRKRILAKLEGACKEPLRFFERLKGADEYKARAGDHRVLALLAFARKAIIVQRVGHRKHVYKRYFR